MKDLIEIAMKKAVARMDGTESKTLKGIMFHEEYEALLTKEDELKQERINALES